MAFLQLDQANLLAGGVLLFSDEYDVGMLCCVSKGISTAANTDLVWKLMLTRKSPSLNFRHFLGELDRANPRRCISAFNFLVGVSLGNGGPFVFASSTRLKPRMDGSVPGACLQNILTVSTNASRLGLWGLSAQLSVLDRCGHVFVVDNFLSSVSGQFASFDFLSDPITVVGSAQQNVVLISLRFSRDAENPDIIKGDLTASTGPYIPINYVWDEDALDDVADQGSIPALLDMARSDSSERSLVEALIAVRMQRLAVT
jgi:hypothetical protein